MMAQYQPSITLPRKSQFEGCLPYCRDVFHHHQRSDCPTATQGEQVLHCQ